MFKIVLEGQGEDLRAATEDMLRHINRLIADSKAGNGIIAARLEHSALPAAPDPGAGDAGTEAEEEEDEKKPRFRRGSNFRGRKKEPRPDISPAPEDPAPEDPAPEDHAPEDHAPEDPAPSASGMRHPVPEDIRSAARAYGETNGGEALQALLREYGARRVSEIAPLDYPAVLYALRGPAQEAAPEADLLL